MRTLAVILTTLTVFSPLPALAQDSGGGVGQAIGNILSGVLGRGGGQVRGHVVQATGPQLILRADDGRTYGVDTSSLPAAEWRNLQPGDAVTVTAQRGTSTDTLVAERIQPEAAVPRATYQTVRGTIQSVSGSEATVQTDDGRTLALDISTLPSTARPSSNQSATIVYEPGRGTARPKAVWVEAGAASTQPSASVATGTQSGYQRMHGYVESIGVSSLTLKTDNGQSLAIDTSGVPQHQLAATRPGDVVSVVGQMAGSSFKASVLQKD
jgi:outer membrane lipoprotein SlyB